MAAAQEYTTLIRAFKGLTSTPLPTPQVSGPGLLPFTFDKQVLLIDAIMASSR